MSVKESHRERKNLGAMRCQSRRIGAACLAAAVFFAMSASAWSAEQSPGAGSEDPAAVAEAISTIRDLEPARVGEPVNSEGVGQTALTGGTVDVPSSGGEGVTFTDAEGESVRIGLPEAAGSQEAEVLDGGTVVFPGKNSANAVIVTEHGTQMLTVMTDGAAPTRYSYEVDLQADQHLELVDGGVVVVDGDGDVTLAAGSAWATDAEGKSVPTWYETDGNTLTQVVDHASAENVSYPVVADPIWLTPWMVRCLVGIGLAGPQISAIASMGNPASILAAFGRAAFACVVGR